MILNQKILLLGHWPTVMSSKSGSLPKQRNHIPQCCGTEEGGQKAFKEEKKSRNAQIPYAVNLEEKGRDRSGGCRLLQAATPSQLLVRPPHRTLEGNIAEWYWQTIRTVFLTLSTCSRFSSLPWSWFLSNRAKSLSCVTAPRVSLRLTYSDFSPKKQKREHIHYIWAWWCRLYTSAWVWVQRMQTLKAYFSRWRTWGHGTPIGSRYRTAWN